MRWNLSGIFVNPLPVWDTERLECHRGRFWMTVYAFSSIVQKKDKTKYLLVFEDTLIITKTIVFIVYVLKTEGYRSKVCTTTYRDMIKQVLKWSATLLQNIRKTRTICKKQVGRKYENPNSAVSSSSSMRGLSGWRQYITMPSWMTSIWFSNHLKDVSANEESDGARSCDQKLGHLMSATSLGTFYWCHMMTLRCHMMSLWVSKHHKDFRKLSVHCFAHPPWHPVMILHLISLCTRWVRTLLYWLYDM